MHCGRTTAWTAFLALTTAAGMAVAQDICVRCAEPAQTYRCAPDANAGAMLSPSDPRLQLLCITEIARQGNHATCSVERSGASACDGPVRLVSPAGVPGLGEAPPAAERSPATTPDAGPPAGPVNQAEKAPAASSNAEPKTVEEMVEKSTVVPKTGLQKAGQSIAKTANAAGDAVTGTAKAAGEAVTDSAKTAGDAVGKAGSAVGSAAKKSWDCVSSFFKNC